MVAVEGVAALVTKQMVRSLLIGRHLDVIETSSTLFDDAVRGATAEVTPLIGEDPDEGPRLDLAVRCIAYLVASELEASLFPEQQSPGDTGRANYLSRRYNELRAQLASTPSDSDPAGPLVVSRSRGNFPAARCYPDPIERPRRWTY